VRENAADHRIGNGRFHFNLRSEVYTKQSWRNHAET
jgi:hypothetical protein